MSCDSAHPPNTPSRYAAEPSPPFPLWLSRCSDSDDPAKEYWYVMPRSPSEPSSLNAISSSLCSLRSLSTARFLLSSAVLANNDVMTQNSSSSVLAVLRKRGFCFLMRRREPCGSCAHPRACTHSIYPCCWFNRRVARWIRRQPSASGIPPNQICSQFGVSRRPLDQAWNSDESFSGAPVASLPVACHPPSQSLVVALGVEHLIVH